MTKKTEASKSAILTAARGIGMDNDLAAYIASMIVADRGKQRSLSETYYGDPEQDFAPNMNFRSEMDKNPKLWEVAQRIEGLVTGVSSHAGGVIIYEKDITKTNSLMKLKSGDYITAYDLHQSEDLSDVKIDMLATEGLVRIRSCLDLLTEYGYLDKNKSLKERYFDTIGVYNINRDNPEMWEKIWDNKVISLFQMEKDSGIKGIKLIKPRTLEELAVLNSVIRLMASEKGAEQPIETWARYRNDITEWYHEMRNFGLSEEDVQWLANHPAITDGMAESQESLMTLLQEPQLGGHSLGFVDKCRKAIAKKQGKLFEECEQTYFDRAKEKNCNPILIDYVWNVLLKCQRGYSFNLSHTLSYSLIGLQEMNLAYFYPDIYWNTANLIVDSASFEETEEDDDVEIEEEPEEEIVSIYEPEDFDNYDYEDLPDRTGKIKKQKKTVDYGKISMALGRFKTYGIDVLPPNINESNYTFTPRESDNTIMYGLRGITRIPNDLISKIIAGRPYVSVADFMTKINPNKLQMLNLIKSGAFDILEDREKVLRDYIESIADKKQRLTLQNMPGLIEYDVIPEEMERYKILFLFNKFLKKRKSGIYYTLTPKAVDYISEHIGDNIIEDGERVVQKTWDKVYSAEMEPMRQYLKDHKDEMLTALNDKLVQEQWDKYATGSISKHEMESIGFYYHDHELQEFKDAYDNFNELPEEPTPVTYKHTPNGDIPIYDLSLLVGTVVNKDKAHTTIALLTPHGLVNVKLYKQQWPIYDHQVSYKNEEGKKVVLEPSWLTRGTLLMVQGIRREQNFILKKYKSSVYPVIAKINGIENGTLNLQYERMEA